MSKLIHLVFDNTMYILCLGSKGQRSRSRAH